MGIVRIITNAICRDWEVKLVTLPSCVSCPALIWLEAVASLKIFCNTVAAGYRALYSDSKHL